MSYGHHFWLFCFFFWMFILWSPAVFLSFKPLASSKLEISTPSTQSEAHNKPATATSYLFDWRVSWWPKPTSWSDLKWINQNRTVHLYNIIHSRFCWTQLPGQTVPGPDHRPDSPSRSWLMLLLWHCQKRNKALRYVPTPNFLRHLMCPEVGTRTKPITSNNCQFHTYWHGPRFALKWDIPTWTVHDNAAPSTQTSHYESKHEYTATWIRSVGHHNGVTNSRPVGLCAPEAPHWNTGWAQVHVSSWDWQNAGVN